MRIQLTKKYAIHVKELPKGTQIKCTNELGRELIDKGVAIEINQVTFEEIDVINKTIAEIENFDKKKHKKKPSKSENLTNESDSEEQLD